ncbi:hypothetical protein CLM62_14720 [Streptomyces sp. SA15]|nr:hypothetical protein CLM62_14720 [Streptomyces sp. SA15]
MTYIRGRACVPVMRFRGSRRPMRGTVQEVQLRRLPSLESAAEAADPRRLEGLAVAGVSEAPVRW